MKKTFLILISLILTITLVACNLSNDTSSPFDDRSSSNYNNDGVETENTKTIEVKQPYNNICSQRTLTILNHDGTVKNGTLYGSYDQGPDGHYNWNYFMTYSLIDGWENIIDIQQSGNYIYGLSKDGTVYGTRSIESSTEKYSSAIMLTDVVAFTTGGIGDYGKTILGIKKDGTVVSSGDIKKGAALNFDAGQNNVEEWTNIVALDSSDYHTVGLKDDGTVVATGVNTKGQCDVSNWTDIVQVHCGAECMVGLRKDGSILITSGTEEFKTKLSQMSNVKAVQVSEEGEEVFCLKNDGTVSIVCQNDVTSDPYLSNTVSSWSGISKITYGYFPETSMMFQEIIFGIKDDGSVVWEVYNEAIHKGVEPIIQSAGGISFN